VRIIKVPCAGIVRVNQVLEAFKAGAQAVMIVGCKADGCHYEAGSQKTEKRMDLAKVLLKEYGIEPERLEMFNMVFIEGAQFAEAAKMMTERATTLGTLKLLGDS
jgi:coenzyme F420-reducing hydrogenase delta subunit